MYNFTELCEACNLNEFRWMDPINLAPCYTLFSVLKLNFWGGARGRDSPCLTPNIVIAYVSLLSTRHALHLSISHVSHTSMSHVSHIWISHSSQMCARAHGIFFVFLRAHLVRKWISNGTNECVMAHIGNSWHKWLSHVTYGWVMSHSNESCPIQMSSITYVKGSGFRSGWMRVWRMSSWMRVWRLSSWMTVACHNEW